MKTLKDYINEASKPGLWDAIHAKRERGQKPAKPGDENYPDAEEWNKLTSEDKETMTAILTEKKADLVGVAKIASDSGSLEEFFKKLEDLMGPVRDPKAKAALQAFYELKTKTLS